MLSVAPTYVQTVYVNIQQLREFQYFPVYEWDVLLVNINLVLFHKEKECSVWGYASKSGITTTK